ncbi:MAG: glucuronate isomerase [Candidatus Limnocylindrales bacterium]|jgi:glucuronate isomerase
MELGPTLAASRLFAPNPAQRLVARELYDGIAGLPIVSPHGHVDPRLLADPDATFGTPTDLFIIPDHYILRMLYSQGIPLEALGVPVRNGRTADPATETDHRRAWQLFADNLFLFRATPSGLWLAHELHEVFGIDEPLTGDNAGAVYDELSAKLARPEFRPRVLFERAGIETLCTTDDAADPLDSHRAIRASGWSGDVRPTFRPDGVVNLLAPGWRDRLDSLSATVGRDVTRTAALVAALEERRSFFRAMGAIAADHGVDSAYTASLDEAEADAILDHAFRGKATLEEARRFIGHMLIEFARMSVEDGLVMQLHVGSFRNHNVALFERFGADIGADIPVAAEFTHNLRPLLERFGNDPRLTLIVFTLDETAYARELAPLAGHYPALRIGPPWWFHDSLNGMARYFDQVIETAGLYNTVGFNDDTRAFCSIPVRHDVWRRASANWLAGLILRGILDASDARIMAHELAYGLAKRAYRLDGSTAAR